MRHTAAFRYQFPVTAYVTPLVFQNPPAPADIQEKILLPRMGKSRLLQGRRSLCFPL